MVAASGSRFLDRAQVRKGNGKGTITNSVKLVRGHWVSITPCYFCQLLMGIAVDVLALIYYYTLQR